MRRHNNTTAGFVWDVLFSEQKAMLAFYTCRCIAGMDVTKTGNTRRNIDFA
jgi:hypothetical protein